MNSDDLFQEENPTVLIVDDSLSIRLYVESLLAGDGYSVATAPDGIAALEYINRKAPEVILLDVEMPGMSGLEVLEMLNMEQRLSSVILFTTRSSLESRVQGLNMGADDYISKPFAESELLARVRAGLRTALLKKELASSRNRAEDAFNQLCVTQRRLISEQRLSAIALLAGGVAHQVNNPLGFMQSNLHTLLIYSRVLIEGADRILKIISLLGDTDYVSRTEVLEMIDWLKTAKVDYIREDIEALIDETRAGGARIASIVSSLQVFDGADSIRKAEMEDLNKLIFSTVATFNDGLPPGVSMITESGQREAPVYCNPHLLNIALGNILQNALDAVGENGEIRVRLFSHGSWSCIQVIDSGDGIPVEILGKVFDPFFTSRMNPGKIGLGLTIAQCLVNVHGGRIEISSAEGKGSNVMIMLPIDSFGSVSAKEWTG